MNAVRTSCLIRVDGHLDGYWSGGLADLRISHLDDGTSTLTGDVADQAQLHGVLANLRDIGASIREVRARPSDAVLPALGQPLRTERLTLRAATEADVESTWAFRRLESVSEWLTSAPSDLDAYRRTFTDPDRLAATVIAELGPAGGPIVGDLMLRREDGWAQSEVAERARGSQAELGWVLDPEYQGHGYATEAVRALVRHCFEDLGVRRVTAICFYDNADSWRLMERVGMRRESHSVRESLHRSGRWLDSVAYALLADEWRR